MSESIDIGNAFTFRRDDGSWDAVVEGGDAQLDVGNYATEGGAVDALRRWAEQRGAILTWATFTIRKLGS